MQQPSFDQIQAAINSKSFRFELLPSIPEVEKSVSEAIENIGLFTQRQYDLKMMEFDGILDCSSVEANIKNLIESQEPEGYDWNKMDLIIIL